MDEPTTEQDVESKLDHVETNLEVLQETEKEQESLKEELKEQLAEIQAVPVAALSHAPQVNTPFTIEHRSFGRPSAAHDMVVTQIGG
jgi:hypothetical protein